MGIGQPQHALTRQDKTGKEDLTKATVRVQSTGLADVQHVEVPRDAVGAFFACKTTNCVLQPDGTDPSAAKGMPIIAGAQPLWLPVLTREVTSAGNTTRDDLRIAGDGGATDLRIWFTA